MLSPLRPAQGRQASTDELAASAYHAVALDQKYNNEPVQIRVTMGKEPAHLMAIFKGKMVVYAVSTGLLGHGQASETVALVVVTSCPCPPGWHVTGRQHRAHALHPPLPSAWHQRVQHQGLRGACPRLLPQLQ